MCARGTIDHTSSNQKIKKGRSPAKRNVILKTKHLKPGGKFERYTARNMRTYPTF